MKINQLYQSEPIDTCSELLKQRRKAMQSDTPLSWGNDELSISDAAKQMALQAQNEKMDQDKKAAAGNPQNQPELEQKLNNNDSTTMTPVTSTSKTENALSPSDDALTEDNQEKDDGVNETLKKYLQSKTKPSSKSNEDRIKELKEQIMALKAQMLSIASDKSLTPALRNQRIEPFQSKLSALESELNELMQNMAKGEAGTEA